MANATSVTVKPSTAHITTDPLRNFKFQVRFQYTSGDLASFGKMGFMSVDGLNVTTEVIPYREGGNNTTTQKMPGQSDFSPITMSRGLAIGDHAQFNWMKRLFSVMQGAGTGKAGEDFRMYVDVMVLAHPVTTGPVPVSAAFRIYNAWPTAVAYSSLDAGANAIIVQQMTLAHEGFDFKVADSNNKGVGF